MHKFKIMFLIEYPQNVNFEDFVPCLRLKVGSCYAFPFELYLFIQSNENILLL